MRGSIALDGETGTPARASARSGQVDLTRGVDLRDSAQYQVTSAPAIAGDLVIVGSSIGDNRAVDVERGIVRAFDARTGRAALVLGSRFPGPSQHRRRAPGGGNAWSTLSVDAERGLVFVPTGSAEPGLLRRRPQGRQQVGQLGRRAAGRDRRARLGVPGGAPRPLGLRRRRAAGALRLEGRHAGGRDHDEDGPRLRARPAHRARRCFPVEERAVPPSDVPGEEASPTQPFSGISLVPERLDAERCLGRHAGGSRSGAGRRSRRRAPRASSPRRACGARSSFPGNVGGVNWGSAAYDPAAPHDRREHEPPGRVLRLIPREKLAAEVARRPQNGAVRGEFAEQSRHALRHVSRRRCLRRGGLPCNAPPWGTVAAVDLFAGNKRWDVPLGTLGSRDGDGDARTSAGRS